MFNTDCPARQVLDHMASRWAVLVLRELSERPHRYHELRAAVDGISHKTDWIRANADDITTHWATVHSGVKSGPSGPPARGARP